ncbi:MAG: hypothetical protein JXP73_04145 [Deltaproteobacteria bacterium]|nr:hypothetical protein [Deltaproteobacteria bacterium]
MKRFAIAAAVLVATAGAANCRHKRPRGQPTVDKPETPLPLPDATLVPGVVAPLLLPAGQAAGARQQAIESIGTYEWQDFTAPGSRLVSTNGDYWTHLADLAWRRDVEIHLDDVALDLDQDGTVDTQVTRHISLRGGILDNPEVFGLAADPDEPPGKLGYTSAGTGFSGLRDALDFETGKPTGEIGMTCWLCHSGRNPVDGKTVLGLPSTRLDYGMMLATSSLFEPGHVLDLDHDGMPTSETEIKRRMRLGDAVVLDRNHDGRVTVAEYRKALGLPDAKQVQATLLSAGPGRQDLSNEFGLDMSAPALHSRRYDDAGLMRTGPSGVFNPKSTPSSLAVRSLSVINWAATYATRGVDWLGRYAERTGQRRGQALAELGIDFPPGLDGDRDLINRAIVLDGRSVGAIGLQGDSFPGILYARVLRQGAQAPPALVRGLRLGFAATPIRKLIYDTDLGTVARPALDAAEVARGRAIFFDRVVGDIKNQQILVHVPAAYADAKIEPPLLAPIDETRPMSARLPVRCVSCHSATTLATLRPIPAAGLAAFRCTDCHLVHEPVGLWARVGLRSADGPLGLTSIFDEFAIDRSSAPSQETQKTCRRCHDEHPALATPIPYTDCGILPFDADGDGRAQGDERDDMAAGGIGTDALFGFEVDRRALANKNVRVPITRIPSVWRKGATKTVEIAGPWVRTAPLLTLVASAPYLHNGSVPTLEALLEPSDARPVTFTLGTGQGAFTFDTRLPGNRNTGHEFGVKLGAEEKRDLIAFLKSL